MVIHQLSTTFVPNTFSQLFIYLLFFFKVFGGHMSVFGTTGTPVLDFWWRLLWVSKPEWVLPYSIFCWGKCNVHSPRSTSDATPANLLMTGIAAGHFPTCMYIYLFVMSCGVTMGRERPTSRSRWGRHTRIRWRPFSRCPSTSITRALFFILQDT